ncbi:hypothetical protein BVY03_01635 [bacterium K02(2017)]|nr:hypothetical protein BVY03_01635 [bacterium K02(2017)]
MKNIIINFIIFLVLNFYILSCSKHPLLSLITENESDTSSSSESIDKNNLPTGLIISNEQIPHADFGGNFRTVCEFSHQNYDDPIVLPNQPGLSHLHMYYGNKQVDASTSLSDLQEKSSSTCLGMGLNASSYWMPALLNEQKEIRISLPGNLYYKSGELDHKTIQPMPQGLKMIASPPLFLDVDPKRIIRWSCLSWTINGIEDFNDFIPICQQGDTLILNILYPQCWDGVNLHLPDHHSHMAYPVDLKCPASHPVPLPQFSFNLDWLISSDLSTQMWRLDSDHDQTKAGGYSTHADFFMAWDEAVMEALVKNCINKGLDCNHGELGNGTQLVSEEL